jgi:TPR repeat protein
MSKATVLFFAADPLSALPGGRPPRLLLDEDVRQIRQKVRAAAHRDALEFDVRWATRTDDLLQALLERRPQVVHFSGHGGSDGLVLVSADGRRPHHVDAAALAQLFKVFRGDIRVVVLNACFSLPQARAIADVVGCAIGTRGEISDEAAITFGASFYRAIAFGCSLQEAYDQARTALALEHVGDRECPELIVRPDIDPGRLVLVPSDAADADGTPPGAAPPREETPPAPGGRRRAARWLGVATATAVVATGAVLAREVLLDGELPAGARTARSQPGASREPGGGASRGVSAADSVTRGMVPLLETGAPPPVAASPTRGDPSGAAAELEAGRSLYQSGNFAAAFSRFQRAAEAGNAEAMGFLGMMYLRGQGTARAPELAIRWLREAGKARDARGMNALGVAYQSGDGVDRSYRWAKHWYTAAAEEKGYAEAMRNLGSLYRQGLGVEQSHEQALAWYRKAVSAGSLEAMVDAGLMYENGWGTRRNTDQALHWYRTAADGGSPRGMFAMGRVYQEGVGVDPDYGQARTWYLRAGHAGSADAMNNMGVLYNHGWGVRANRDEAIRWFRKAAAAGSAVAEGNLAALGAG